MPVSKLYSRYLKLQEEEMGEIVRRYKNYFTKKLSPVSPFVARDIDAFMSKLQTLLSSLRDILYSTKDIKMQDQKIRLLGQHYNRVNSGQYEWNVTSLPNEVIFSQSIGRLWCRVFVVIPVKTKEPTTVKLSVQVK